ncbi:hypothetical protein [Xanthobacter sp. 126]|uniref:hypothetical protein n=1 Tax=Xanthobacter sp. 126 TaxID=1131814 RepID=UPI00045EC439|nr:hypothetical protein [Xanthobacter sp. 126]
MAKATTKARAAAATQATTADPATLTASEATASEAAAGAGEQPLTTDTLPSEDPAPAAEDGQNPPSTSQPEGRGVEEDTKGAPTGDGGEEPSGSEPSEPDAPATAAAAGEDPVPPEPAPPTENTAGESGKAPEAAAAVASEPTTTLEFGVCSPIELDGTRYEPGSSILLTHKLHRELKPGGAILGDWPAE